MIIYQDNLENITPDHLRGGFFVGWPNPPSPEVHYRILQNSTHILLAIREENGQVIGYISALSDNTLFAYISSLEVLPAYQKRGIGLELTRQLLEKLRHIYAIDLLCDPDVQPFYARLGMMPLSGMAVRNYERQSGQS